MLMKMKSIWNALNEYIAELLGLHEYEEVDVEATSAFEP